MHYLSRQKIIEETFKDRKLPSRQRILQNCCYW